MDRNTIIAIILMVVVMSVGLTLQSTLFAPPPPEATATQSDTSTSLASDSVASGQSSSLADSQSIPVMDSSSTLVALGESPSIQRFTYETGVFIIEFDPAGAGISSIRLKKHLDKGEPVELLFNDEKTPVSFLMYVGDDINRPIVHPFSYRIEGNKVIFSRMFALANPDGSASDNTFTVEKTYNFSENDYLFELGIEIRNSKNLSVPLNLNGYAYTLAFEPQLGPEFYQTPDGNYTYRRFYTEMNGKKQTVKLKDGKYETSDFISWAAITSKYFSVIGIPYTRTKVTLTESKTVDIPLESRMYFSRPTIKMASNTDLYRFYLGPQLKENLAVYNDPSQNGFGLKDLNLENALDSGSWLGWLENILKWLLTLFHKMVPNWGVAIILLTILIKVILQPFSKKSLESTSKMQALNPQMEELRAKYKDNPTKLNQEMGELYKREKINPLGGCLPMLLQFPIFIALYGLLNKHFELRGAMFIPGWIEDLSIPESIINFAPLKLPLIGSDLRLLPLLYGASMIFSFKISQTGSQQGGMTGKIMMYGMPIMFFFVLYNAPSGLLLYWMVMNVISIGQQMFVNYRRKHKKATSAPTANAKSFGPKRSSKR